MSSFDIQSAWNELEYAEEMAAKMVVGYEHAAVRQWRKNLESIEQATDQDTVLHEGIDARFKRALRRM